MSLLNGGFETGDFTGWSSSGGWTFGPPAVVSSLDVRSGTYACWLGARLNPGLGLDDDSTVSAVEATTAGERVTGFAWLCVPTLLPSQSPSATIFLQLIDVDTATVVATRSVSQADLAVGEFAMFTVQGVATGPTTRLRISMVNDGVTNGTWYAMLDDCDVLTGIEAIVGRGMYDGWTALVSKLRSINGDSGGFYHDLTATGRVITRHIAMDEEGAPTHKEYLCVPFNLEEETFEHEERSVKARWTQTIWAYVKETSSSKIDSAASDTITKIRDDLARLFLLDPQLSNAVQDVRLVSSRRTSGTEAGSTFSELQFDIEILQIFDASDLGPLA